MGPPSRIPKMTTQTLLDFDLEESSSDSDFRIEDHNESDDDFSENSNAEDSENSNAESSSEDSKSDFSDFKASLLGKTKKNEESKETKNIMDIANQPIIKQKLPTNPICCACLGDRSDDTNEIVECDGCGVSVHEGCYGVSDSTSVSSTISSCSTEPWFCEACKAGIQSPACELCPNSGGIFKETDVGKWVHLVCALYVPGVAFGEVDQLSSVTLFEMPYSKWGAKTCSLCEDAKYARTGVCIGCDAGMCKTYFHVTCAQAAGFLSEAHSEEVDHADPFYAHCRVHSDKAMIKHRKRNFNTLKMRMEQRNFTKIENLNEKPSLEQLRIQRKLNKHQLKYKSNKILKSEPWVPTQKMPRLLTTSATACRRLLFKAELMGIDTAALEFQEAQMAALADVRKKWHIPAAFSVEFIGYYLDRITRLKELKSNLERDIEINKKLLEEQQSLRDEYDQKVDVNAELISTNTKLKDKFVDLHKQMQVLCPNKTLPSIENIGRPILVTSNTLTSPSSTATATTTATSSTTTTTTTTATARPMSVPTAAALKMGVGFPLINLPGKKDDTGRILSTQRQNSDDLVHECGICKRCNDQHLLAKCDTCHFYYHLGCLNPPLTRHPKKSKLYGWQCSECDKSDDSDTVVDLPKGPRKSRTRFSKDGTIVPVDPNLSSNTDCNSSIKSETSSLKRKSIEKLDDISQVINLSTNGKLNQKEHLSSPTSNCPNNIKKMKRTTINHKKSMDSESNDKINLEENLQETKIKLDPIIKCIKTDDIKKKLKVEDLLKLEDINEMSKATVQLPKIKETKRLKKERKSDDEKIQLKIEKTINNIQKMNSDNFQKSTTNSEISNKSSGNNLEQTHKQNRKRRKEKHRNKYISDNDKSPNKEHKRKRKKKNHDIENPNDSSIPKIKIKFKTLPLPGEVAPEPQFFYVSADMVRPLDTSRPTSVETVDDSTMNADDMNNSLEKTPLPATTTSTPITGSTKNLNTLEIDRAGSTPILSTASQTIPKSSGSQSLKSARITSPRKSNKRESTSISNSALTNDPLKIELRCDVCNQPGTNQNIVKCDECQKIYHFTCLDPPLKKTPKRRGYSWHCADCDPTDIEST